MNKPPQGLPKDNNLSYIFGNEITTSSDTFITHRGRLITPPQRGWICKSRVKPIDDLKEHLRIVIKDLLLLLLSM